ncbi:cation transporter [Candidatus Woesearchaeota archaeon]|nr:cation transporter [Candidatus Woesearchaeota archaeon]
MKKVNIKIKGMHCPSCEILIQDILEETEGVKKAKVSLKTNSAEIEFDEKEVQLDYLKSLIRQEGYKIE